MAVGPDNTFAVPRCGMPDRFLSRRHRRLASWVGTVNKGAIWDILASVRAHRSSSRLEATSAAERSQERLAVCRKGTAHARKRCVDTVPWGV
eukprot:5574860-Prymnesium_polylepis.1